MAEYSVSALDLSLSTAASPLKHPAFASTQELASAKKRRSRVVTRNNSTPNEWRTAGYVVYNENGENEGLLLQRGNSVSKSGRRRPGGSGHFVRRGSGFYTHSTTASESDSSLDPRRSGHFSASCSFLSTAGVPTPQIRRSNRHIYCHLPPDMENPNIKKRLRKSPSNDSGHSSSGGGATSGGTFPRIKSTGRKRHGSSESASTTSSGSLGSLKERLEKTEPVLEPVIKKRSSLASLISRKSADKKSSSPALSNDEGIVSGPSSPTPQHEASPKPSKSSSFSLKYVLRRSSSNSKLAHHEDHLKSFVGSNPHISMREDTEEEIMAEEDKIDVSLALSPPPPKPLRTYAMDNERIKEAVSSSSTLPLNASSPSTGKLSKSSTLPAKGKKGKDEATKTPTKKVFSKLFGKNKGQAKEKDQGSMANESKGAKKKSPSPDIVELESEPRKLVPRSDGGGGKPRIVLTVAGRDFKDISEMEVSEEAVELAKKLRELQRQADEHKTREEETKSLREVVVVGRNQQQLSSPVPYENDCDEDKETQGDNNKTGSRKHVRSNGRTMGCFGGSPPDETPKGRVGEILADHQRYSSSTSSSSPQTPGRSSDEDQHYSNDRNNSSCSRHEFESGIGHESPTSSLEDPLGSHNNSNHHDDSHYGQYDEEDEEETSMATTITTTASEMDASFMLSRSLALTEEDYSYTESFKQLKPFNFDHIDPIPQGKRERLYKVLVVGELGTGKTSIIKRYVHQFFSQHYRATIGVDFALKVLRWDPETVVRLQLWDIAGQERFGSMTRVYYKEAVGAFVVFDVTRAATLEAVPKWKADLDAKVVLPDGRPIPTVLLANKSDQPKEGIAANRDKMNEFCQQQGFSAWFQTSAKDNINIDESANFLVSKILEMDKWSQEPMASDPEKLDLSANGKARGGGDSNCAC